MTNSIPLFSARIANSGMDFMPPLQRVLDSYWYILGKEMGEFEKEFASYCEAGHCVGVANGTDALELALKALGVGVGDKVLVAPNAGFYGNTALRSLGAVALYADVDPKTLTLDPGKARQALESKPKALIATHLYGQLADMKGLLEAAAKAGVPVIEDCAQAHGASRAGKKAGSFGTIGCFSFYPTKNLGALGDGGALTTQDGSLAARLRQLRQYGWDEKYQVTVPGGRNSRLDELQAAVLREKLPRLDEWNEKRRAIARRYNEAFQSLPLQCPASVGEDYVAHLYVVRLKNRDKFRDFLKQEGVTTDVHYPTPDHLQAVSKGGPGKGSLPVAEEACETVVSLPCFPGLTDGEVGTVIGAVKRYFEKAAN